MTNNRTPDGLETIARCATATLNELIDHAYKAHSDPDDGKAAALIAVINAVTAAMNDNPHITDTRILTSQIPIDEMSPEARQDELTKTLIDISDYWSSRGGGHLAIVATDSCVTVSTQSQPDTTDRALEVTNQSANLAIQALTDAIGNASAADFNDHDIVSLITTIHSHAFKRAAEKRHQ